MVLLLKIIYHQSPFTIRIYISLPVKMSVNAQVHLSKNENNKKNDKALKPLFPKQAECSYVSCYWRV